MKLELPPLAEGEIYVGSIGDAEGNVHHVNGGRMFLPEVRAVQTASSDDEAAGGLAFRVQKL